MSLDNIKKYVKGNNKYKLILNDKNSLDAKDGKEKATKLKSMENYEEKDSNFITSFFLGNIDYKKKEPNNKLNIDKDSIKIKSPDYIYSKDILFIGKNNEFNSSLNNNFNIINQETENDKGKLFKQNLAKKNFEIKEEEQIYDKSFMSNNSIMNLLSENVIDLYLKQGNNKDIDEFFKNYLRNPKNRDIKQIQMIISSQEFQYKAQKYRKNVLDLSKPLLPNDNMFLNRKHKLSGNEINLKLNNKNQAYSFIKKIKIDLSLNNNYIKIKNNRIINEDIDKNILNQEYIDYQSVFIEQFVRTRQKKI